MDDDHALLEAFQRGDESAFGRLLERHQGGVFNFFLRMGAEASTAEDLTQEVFVRVFRGASTYRPTARFTTWLYQVARNRWIDETRGRKRRVRTVSLDRPVESSGESGTTGVWSERFAAPDIPDTLRADEIRDTLRGEIERLPEGERWVLVLASVEGLSYAEVAEVLEIPEGTVKSRMFSAVRRLRERLRRAGIEGPE